MRRAWCSFLRAVCNYSCGFSGFCAFLSWCCHFHPARPRASRSFPPGRRLDPWLSLPGKSQNSFPGSLLFLRVQSVLREMSLSSPREYHWLPWVQGVGARFCYMSFTGGVETLPWGISTTRWVTLPKPVLEFEGCEFCCEGVRHWVPCCHGLIAGIKGLLLPSRGRSMRFLRDGVQSTRVTEG